MKALLDKFHSRLGDFWWYSLMIFCAQRTADCMNVFVGLYLVPKYVDPSELGAVMPLTQFAGCLALPIAVFASTFRNEIVNLAIEKRFGQLKTLLRGTFVATGIFLVLAFAVSWFVLPHYLARMRLAKGSLGILIVLLAFVTNVSPIFNNALQALKKFKATSIIGILGAPIRLVSMALVLPLRPISGYFAGQTSTPVFGIVASIFALRKELSVKAEPYWSRTIFRRVGRFAAFSTISAIAGSFWILVSNTVLRQRLPELDSAAYYMASRFSEISGFLSMTLIFTMFPFTAGLAREGKSTNPLVIKSSLAMIAFCVPLAAVFWFWGASLLELLPHGTEYAPYFWLIPWMIGIACLNSIASFYTGSEVSAERFGYLWWSIPVFLGFAAALLFVTGYGYFTPYLPASVTHFLKAHNVTSIEAYLMWMTAIEVVRVICCAVQMHVRRQAQPPAACSPAPDLLSFPHAKGTGEALHDGQPHDGGGLHPFASRRERALSDLRRIRVLAEALSAELLRASQHGERASVRDLTTAVVNAAKQLGCYRPYESLKDLGDIKRRRSGESEVFASAANALILKVKDPSAKEPIKRTSPADWFYEHIIHNILFPDTAYEFIGVTEQAGRLRIIIRQRNVESVARPSDAQIATHLTGLGLRPEDRYFFGNDLLAVTDVSAQSDNVLLDDNGNLRFIDPLIRLKKPAVEVIKALVGDLT